MTVHFCERAVALQDPIGIIQGYVAIWGDQQHRDAYKTFFDRERPPEMGLDNGMHRRPIMYEHAQDGAIRKEVIGFIDEIFFDEVGIGYVGHLDRSCPFFGQIVSELRAQKLKTSSATMEHTADFYDDGAFRVWILGELSLTAYPAESRMPASVLVRSEAEGGREDSRDGDEPFHSIENSDRPNGQRGINAMTLQDLLKPEVMDQGVSVNDLVAALVTEYGVDEVLTVLQQMQPPAQPETTVSGTTETVTEMSRGLNIQDVVAELQRRKAEKQRADEFQQVRSQIDDLKQQLQRQVAAPPEQDTTRHAPNGGANVSNVNLIESRRFARYSHMEFMAAAEIARQNNVPLSEPFQRALAHRAVDFLQGERNSDDAFISYYRSTHTRADDFMASDIPGQGQEAVGIFYGTKIWEKARIQPITDAVLKRGMMEIEVPDGANSEYVPLEGDDPTFYTTAQANDLDATNRPEVVVNTEIIGTDRILVTPGEITGAVAYTDILAEDALFNVATEINRKLNLKAPEVVEGLLVNGDTATAANVNINVIDGQPATGLSKPYYLASDGLLKLPLVTNPALSRDANGAHTEADYLATIRKLPDELVANPEGLMFIEDVTTYQSALDIASIKTLDVAGSNYTLFTGKVPPMYGVDVFRTGRMALANNVGKISATPANNTLGRILCIYPEYWAMIWKRRISFEQARYPLSKVNVVIASLRIAFRRRSDNAASLSYNVGV